MVVDCRKVLSSLSICISRLVLLNWHSFTLASGLAYLSSRASQPFETGKIYDKIRHPQIPRKRETKQKTRHDTLINLPPSDVASTVRHRKPLVEQASKSYPSSPRQVPHLTTWHNFVQLLNHFRMSILSNLN